MASWWESFFHPEKGYEREEDQIRQGYDEAEKYGQPYQQAGQDEIQKLIAMQQALANPGQLENEWSKSYEMSPEAQAEMERSMSQGKDIAGSMGLLGSSAALSDIQKTAGDIRNTDRRNYLNDMMQKYMASIGIGQGIMGQGASFANNLAQQRIGRGQELGGYEQARFAAPGSMMGKLIGLAGQTGLNYLTGGFGQGGFGRGSLEPSSSWANAQRSPTSNNFTSGV